MLFLARHVTNHSTAISSEGMREDWGANRQSTLAWKISRLRTMSASEIFFRVRRALYERVEAANVSRLKPVPPFELIQGRAPIGSIDPSLDIHSYLVAAERLLDGYMTVFALDCVPFPPEWNRDTKTGTQAPLTFGKGIDYRRADIVGDIKYLWEPNRHSELVVLAQAWLLSGDQRYLDAVGSVLDDWMAACPYPLGPNWSSSLELGLRLVNWAFVWQMIGGLASPLFADASGIGLRDRWLASIYRHLDFIDGHLSLYSSANNHLLGEYLGLLFGSTIWPCWPASTRWRATALQGFSDQAMMQTAPDGVNREQAVYYHHEVMDMMLLGGLLARANGYDFEPSFWKRLEDMCDFLAAIMDVNGAVPMIGDADDARIIRLNPDREACPYQSLLASCAIIFDRPDFAAKAGKLDDKTRWLFPSTPLPTPVGRNPRVAFPEGGYFLLGSELNTANEVRIVADCGPLGYLSIAAHGHADALSITLSACGVEWLVDPGTFAYHTQKIWRDHFRGTGAHNTLRIDGADQSEIGGNFLWHNHARAELVEHDFEAGVFEGAHDGYSRLLDPVRHRRRLEFDAHERTLRIIDTLTCKSCHTVDVSLQFAEACNVCIDGSGIVAKQAGLELEATCNYDGFSVELLHGIESPPVGWVSRKFDKKVPSTMARWSGVINGDTTIVTLLRLPKSVT